MWVPLVTALRVNARACTQRAPRAFEAAGAGVPSAQPASMPYSGPSWRSRAAPTRAVTCRSSPTA